MSDTRLLVLAVLELAGLIGLFAFARRTQRRKAAGEPRDPRGVRIAVAALGLVVVVGFPAVMIATIVGTAQSGEREQARLRERGVPATATITDVRETGKIVNRQPEIEVRVDVHPSEGPGFASRATWVFTTRDVQTYRVGAEVQVRYEPGHPEAVAIVGLVESSP